MVSRGVPPNQRDGSLERPPARTRLVPSIAGVAVAALAVSLLAIGARSPYTHSNLAPGFDPTYGRTEQVTVGPPTLYLPAGRAKGGGAGAGSATSGATLLVLKGCASCHGLEGRGTAVGPPIAGVRPELSREQLQAKTQKGPGGMPAYAAPALPDAELAAIAAFLGSIVPDPAAPSTPERGGAAVPSVPPLPQRSGASFREDIEPLLRAQCASCHKAEGKANFSVRDREAVLLGGKSGPAVVPGDPDKSLLVQKLRPAPPFGDRMPVDAVPLDEEVIAQIADWIRRGALDD